MKTLLVPATLTSVKRKKDMSVTFSFTSMNEINNDDFSLMDKYFQQNGYLAFKLDEVKDADIPIGNTNITGELSPSTMQRRKIFALHMKKGGTKEDFGPYYQKVMHGISRSIQAQIDEIED